MIKSYCISIFWIFYFFSCASNLILYPRSPENGSLCTLWFWELPTHRWPLSVAHESPGEDIYTQNITLVCWELLPAVRNQEGCLFYFSTRTWRLTKKLKRKHKSRGANCLLDVWKDSIPSESHLETATLTPRAKPLLPKSHSLHPPGLGHFQTQPRELVNTPRGSKGITLYSTESAAGFQEAQHRQPNWISNTYLVKQCHGIVIDDKGLALWIYISPGRWDFKKQGHFTHTHRAQLLRPPLQYQRSDCFR